MKLSKNQIHKLSDISSDVGLVSLAAVVLPAALVGLVATIVFWILSILLRR